MFTLRTLVIALTAFVLALAVGTQVYGQSNLPSPVNEVVDTTIVSADTLLYDTLGTGPEVWQLLYKDVIAEATQVIKNPTSALAPQDYYNLPGSWGG